MENAKKVYDFPFEKVQSQVVNSLRKNQNRGTVTEVIGLTGLPKYQVEKVLPVVADQCRGQLQVTEKGEILYNFPKGMANQMAGSGPFWKRFFKKAIQWTGKALAFLFKIWIVVMLVGYFALFVVILIIALLVSIGLSFARRDDRDDSGGGVMGFYLVTRVFEFFLMLWLYSGDPVYRQTKKKKPFHRAVFEFVFGVEEKPEVRAKAERKVFISYVQNHKGAVTLEEIMSLTGKSREDADAFASRILLEYEGEPQVSEEGTLYFFFPELLKTSGKAPQPEKRLADEELIPFTHNPAGTNRWIVFLNGFNIVLGAYFLGFGLSPNPLAGGDSLSFVFQVVVALLHAFTHFTLPQILAGVTLILGFVPAAYSAFFFSIPLVRRLRENVKNQWVKLRNFRRKLAQRVLTQPLRIDLTTIEPDSERNAAGKPGPERGMLKESLLRDLAGNRSVEVDEAVPVAAGKPVAYLFSIPDLDREQKDLASIRQKVDLTKYDSGKVIFDTDSKEIL